MYWICTLFYVIFHLHAGKTEILMKRSNIVRKQARRRCWNKAGCWRVKILVNSLSCESLSWRDAVCWQITQHLFVSDWQWPCVEQRDAGHTRIKNELDKIGIKKQEVEQSMLTFSSLMLKPNRIRTFDAMTWTPEYIHLRKWKTPASVLQASQRLWDRDYGLVRIAIVPPEEACQVVWEKAEGRGVKVKMVGLQLLFTNWQARLSVKSK